VLEPVHCGDVHVGGGVLKSLSLSYEHRHTHIKTHTHTHTPVHTYTCARICNHMVKQTCCYSWSVIAADSYKRTQTGCDVQVQLYKSWISVPSAPVTQCCVHSRSSLFWYSVNLHLKTLSQLLLLPDMVSYSILYVCVCCVCLCGVCVYVCEHVRM